jgi:chromosome segregation ATPase
VGAASRIVFERLTIRTDDDHVNDNAQNTGGVDEEKTLSQVIVKLKETINKKDKRILELENEVRAIAGRGVADTILIKQRNEAESKNTACSRELEMLKMESAVLKIKVKELESFKTLISENENGDIIINLSNLTADQKRQIETLQAELTMQSGQLGTAKREKLELQNLLKTRNAENDELRNEKINLMQRIIEKDSAITALEEKVVIIEDALTQCTRNCQTPKPKSEKKRSKKQQGDAALFDE